MTKRSTSVEQVRDHIYDSLWSPLFKALLLSAQFAFTFSLGGLLSFFQGCLLYSSIGVVFCGLLLAGDIGHELCSSWSSRYQPQAMGTKDEIHASCWLPHRYSGLRRVDPLDELALKDDNNSDNKGSDTKDDERKDAPVDKEYGMFAALVSLS
jgi:hypothetical protein